jgi:hypothetical protein
LWWRIGVLATGVKPSQHEYSKYLEQAFSVWVRHPLFQVDIASDAQFQRVTSNIAMRESRREDAVVAVRAWYAAHSRLPSYREWVKAAPGRPTSRTIARRWGWEELIAEALSVRVAAVPNTRREARRMTLLRVLATVHEETGFWPTGKEWERAGCRPSRRTYVRAFGSWQAACEAAACVGGEVLSGPGG